MASGLPVIVSDRCGCAEDLVDKARNGLTFDPARPEQLLACLHAISNASSSSLAVMRKHSSHVIERYSPTQFGLEILRLTGG